MGRAEDAVDQLIDALRADPRDAQALFVLGNHYARRAGDPVAARRFLERAAEITPNDPLVHNSLAALHFESKQPVEALKEFDRALELDAGLAHAHYGRSMVLMTEGQFTEAVTALATMFQVGNGLNYTDSDKVYTLKSAPGETFTGLGLMCLMYAGIQRLAPAGADVGMDMHDEFAMALSLYHSEKER